MRTLVANSINKTMYYENFGSSHCRPVNIANDPLSPLDSSEFGMEKNRITVS